MNLLQARLPSAPEYARAFRTLESTITDKQRELLRVHHASPARVTSATRLAQSVEFSGYRAVNLQYGKLGVEVAKVLGYDLGARVKVGMLVEFVDPQYATNEEWLWVMRQPVVQALESLGWVNQTSHLLYPDEAAAALADQAVKNT